MKRAGCWAERYWAVEITGSARDKNARFLLGALTPPYALLFDTRREARDRLKAEKVLKAWCFAGAWAHLGGRRIYRNGRVVRVALTLCIERGRG
jgi:hypothetical protein